MGLRVELLGQARVLGESDWQPLPQDKRGALLAVLACHGDWLSREKLAFLFWPDVPDEQARVNLRQLLARVKPLALAQGLDVEARRLRWAPTSDVSAFREAQACEQWEAAAALYRGPLLGDFELLDAPEFSSWLELERREFEDRYRQAVARASAQLEHSGDAERALALWARLLEHDPLDEHGLQQVLRLAVASEQTAAALQLHARFEERLSRELGLRPQAATQDFAEKARRSTPAPERLQVERRYQLPPTAAYLGRDFEITELLNFLGQRERRLITLLGPGGIGKTALALQVAREAASQFPDGVAFAPLAALQDAALIPSTVASALGLYLRPGEAPEAQLLSFLRDKALLLVLDNLEHLPGSADFIGRILESRPKLTVLATSRSRLRLQSEWLFPVEGLSYPQQDGESPLESYDAVRLFVLRARQVQPDFALTAANREAVRRICQRVVGAPLALELAAGWTRLISCQEIADALSENLDALQGELHDLPERHQSLRAVFEHSWQLLSPEEQTVLSQLSVFQGGFEREAAKAVTGASASVLLALLDKSLLKRNADGRFDLHELIRQYAAEKLAEAVGEKRAASERHGLYFASFVQAQGRWLRGGARQKQALEAVARELDNVRETWHWLAEARRADGLVKMLPLLHFYEIRGLYREGEAAFAAAVAALPESTLTRAKLLTAQAVLAGRLGALEASQRAADESRILMEQLGETDSLTVLHLGVLEILKGNLSEAEALHLKALRIAEETGDLWMQAGASGNLGIMAAMQGRSEATESFYEASANLFDQLEERWGASMLYIQRGIHTATQGNHQMAQQYFDTALQLARSIGQQPIIVTALSYLGNLASQAGRYQEAETHLQESLKLADELGLADSRECTLIFLGQNAQAQGDYRTAFACYLKVLDSARARNDERCALDSIVNLAGVLATSGEPEAALDLLTFALRQTALHTPREPEYDLKAQQAAEQLYRDLAARLPEATLKAAEDRARALSYADILQHIRAHPLNPQTKTIR